MLFEQTDLERGDRKLLFHHIPKTAGSTLRYRLESLFGEELVCRAETPRELEDAGRSGALEQYRFFAGHFSFSVIKKHLEDAIWITFLREPTERVVSQFFNHRNPDRVPSHWKKRVQNNAAWARYVERSEGIALEDWLMLDDPVANSISCNRQLQAFIELDVREKVDDWSIHRPDLVDQAKAAIESRFHFVGIQEYFDLSISLLEWNLGLLPLQDQTSTIENVNDKKAFGARYDIDAEISRLIRDRNSMDWELYRWMRGKFLHHATALLRDSLANRIADRPVPPLLPETPSHTHVPIETLSSFDVSGLHRLEKAGDRAFRWTGNCEETLFVFNLALFEQDQTFTIRFLNAASDEVLKSLSITVNGEEVLNRSIRTKLWGNGGTIEFPMDSALRRNPVILRIQSHLVDEASLSGEGDRKLGIAISGFELTKADA